MRTPPKQMLPVVPTGGTSDKPSPVGDLVLDVARCRPIDAYFALVDVVNPRPIGWISTLSPEGKVNLAPYSFFNAVSGRPPMVAFSAAFKRDGSKKDSHRNAELTGEFVCNAATSALIEQVNLSSKELPYGDSEVDLTGLTLLPSTKVKPPRIAEAPVHMECKVWQILPLGDNPSAHLIIGEVLVFHIAAQVLNDQRRIDPHKLQTVGRLGGDWYCHSTDLFTLKRPE